MRADFEAYLQWKTDDSLAQLLAAADEAGIDYVVVMPNAEVNPQNERLIQDIAGNPRLLGCAMIDPRRPTAVEEVRRTVRDGGCKGIKLMAAIHQFELDDEPLVRPVVESAAELGVVVSIHSGRANCHPNKIGTIAGWIPDTPVVMDHMGLPDNLAEGVAQAQAHPNIVLGTTILRFHKRWGEDPDAVVATEVKTAIETLGPRRIVLGSNYPEYRPIQVMNALRRLELGDAAERLIFGENLGRIYGLS